MRPAQPTRWRSIAPALIVLILAAVARLSQPGIVRYEYDEMQVTVLAKEMVAGIAFPLEGIISSVGIPNSPMTIYICAIPYFVSHDPLVATLFVALWNIVGVALLWGFARHTLGPRPAFVAGLVYAANPWAAMFSRKIWAQSILMMPVIGLFWLGVLGFIDGKRWAQALFLPVLAIIVQIHYSAVLLVPALIWFIWRGRHHLAWRALLASAILAALLTLPFLVGISQFTSDEWARYEAVLQRTETRRDLTLQPLHDLRRLITGLEMEHWWTPLQIGEGRASIGAPALLWELLAAAAVAGAVILLRQPRVRRSRVPLALWIGLPVGLFALGWTEVIFHYFLFVIPALAILVGVCVDWLVGQRPHWLRAVVAFTLALILLTQVRGWHGLLAYVDAHATPHGMGTPLHYLLEPRAALMRYDDVLIANDSLWTWRSLLLNAIGSVREAALPGGELVVVPAGEFAVVSPAAAPNPVYRSDQFEVFPLRPGEDGYRVDHFPASLAWEGAAAVTPIEPAALFDNDVQLIGYAHDSQGILLAWRLPDARSTAYQYFVHVLDRDGNRIAQIDSPFWQGKYWRRDDHIFIRARLEWPSGAAHLRVGLYQLRDQQVINSNVVGPDGAPLQQWADIAVQ